MTLTPHIIFFFVQDIAKYIIFQDRPTSMEDARKLFEALKVEDDSYLVECQAMFYVKNEKVGPLGP